MATVDTLLGQKRSAPQEGGGTKSLTGATREPGTPTRTQLPIIYQVPLDGPPGVMYVDGSTGEVVSASDAKALIAASAVRVVRGAPPNLQFQFVNGKFPTHLIPGIENPEVQKFLAVPSATPPTTVEGDGEELLGGAAVSGTGQATSETFQPIAPPVLDILDRLSQRRQAERDASLANFAAVLGAAPTMVNPAAQFFPGLEPGGLGDIALGQISGKGTEAAESLIPTATREFFRVPLPGLASPQEPTLESEFGGAMGLAEQILNLIRLFQTGASQQTSVSTGGGGSELSPDLALAKGIRDEIIGGIGL